MEKKKNFIYPEAIIVEFANEDVIVTSSTGEGPGPGNGEPDDDWNNLG